MKRGTSMKTATEQILELKKQISENSGILKDNKKFMGAGIIITDDEDTTVYDSEFNVVRTKYAYELSSLVFHLKGVVSANINTVTKYNFYGSLADFANEYISREGDGPELLGYVLDKVSEYANEKFRYLYFAYGSNMDKKQMALRCPNSKYLGIAKLEGYEFCLDSKGYSSISEVKSRHVWGAIWNVSEEDIRSLDRHEGVAAGAYERVTVKISTDESDLFDALAYISLRDIENINKNPEYLQRVIKAATECWMDEEYVERIREFEK